MLLKKCLFCIAALLIFLNTAIMAQIKFPIGIYSNARADQNGGQSDWDTLDQIKSLGMNWIIHESRYGNKSKLENLFDSVIASNCYSNDTDAVHYYSSGYYSKWEAEENAPDNINTVGIKHSFGSQNTAAGVTYWTSGTSAAYKDSMLIRGPNYHQDKNYKIWVSDELIHYNLTFRLKRGSSHITGGYDTLAKVTVLCYNTPVTEPFYILTNSVSTTQFKDTTFSYDFRSYSGGGTEASSSPSHMNRYSENRLDTANVQFIVQWYGSYELMIDYIEVMDEAIWGQFLVNNTTATSRIQTQVNKFSSWTKLKYMYALDEPGSIDNYIPYKTIQNLVLGYGGKPLITALVPLDTYSMIFDGEKSIPRWVTMAEPKKLMFDFYPFNIQCQNSNDVNAVSGQFNFLRNLCQAANKYQKNNYLYVAQAHGYSLSNNNNATLNQPTANEFREASLLALAHGAKGLMYYCYKSSYSIKDNISETISGLLNSNGTHSPLWDEVQSFTTRMHGTFGDKLLNLEYNDVFLRIAWNMDSRQTSSQSDNCSYLRIWRPSSGSQDKGVFHCGLLSPRYPDSLHTKYFLLLNELTPSNYSQSVMITASKPSTSFINYTLRDVENNFNESFSDSLVKSIPIPAGNGYLFYIGPTIKYGGTITANETVNTTDTLKGDLAIASGAILTISGTYNVRNNITVNSGGTLYVNPGATLKFLNNSGLYVNGTLTANGTSSQRITFDFKTNSNGIFINSGGASSISYCNISNAYYGVRCQGNLTSFSNNNVTNNTTGLFVENASIQQVSYNTITGNSSNGISAFNSEFSISNNFIRDNSNIGINIYDGSSISVQNNSITGNSQYGIFVNYNSEAFISYSSGYQNLITGNRYGVYTNWNSTSYLNYNCLYDNNKNSTPSSPGYEVILTRSSIVEAQNNWWGDTLVNPNRIYIGTGTTINYSNPLNTTLCNGMSKAIATGSTGEQEANSDNNKYSVGVPGVSVQTDKELDSAAHLKYEKKYEQAMAIYDKIISKEGNSSKAIFALIGMSNCYKESKNAGFIDYLNKSVRSKYSEKDKIYSVSLELENNWLLADKRYKDILSNLDKLKSNYSDNQEAIKGAIFKTGYIYLTFLKDTARAKAEFELLASKYPDDELVYMSTELMGMIKNMVGKSNEGNNSNIKSNKNLKPSDFQLEQNYPNPFNPVTTINYSLPVDSKVRLVIFNSLGQEVAVLADNIKTAGVHNVIFNAGHLSSGVYFYSLTAQPIDGSRKDYQSNKKMLLIK